jgi:NAD(P)H-dependent FMN reductase
MKPRIVGVCGSLREGSRTLKALEITLSAATQAGAQTELINLRDLNLPFYDDRDDVSTYPQSVRDWNDKIRGAQALVLATPVYHATLSGALKNALDLLSFESWPKGKITGLISVAGGMSGVNAINTLVFACQALEALTLPITVAIHGSAFDEGDVVIDAKIRKRLEALGVEMMKSIR